MVRAFVCSVALLAFVAVCVHADDQKKTIGKEKKRSEATITKVDPQKGTVTVKMKDKNGKETERTFRLAADVVYLDNTGKVAAVDVFRSGDQVLIVEAEGQIKEIRKHDKNKNK